MDKRDVVPDIGILITVWLIAVLPMKKAVAVDSPQFIITNEYHSTIQLVSTQSGWQYTHLAFVSETSTIGYLSPEKILINTDLELNVNSATQFPDYVLNAKVNNIFDYTQDNKDLLLPDYGTSQVMDVAKAEFINGDTYQFSPQPIIKNQSVIAQVRKKLELLKPNLPQARVTEEQRREERPETLNIGYLSPDKILINTESDLSVDSGSQFPDYVLNAKVNNIFDYTQENKNLLLPDYGTSGVIDVAKPEFINGDTYQFTPQDMIKNQPIAQAISNQNQQSQLPLEPVNPSLPVPKVPEVPDLTIPEEEPPEQPPEQPPLTAAESRKVLTALMRSLLESSASKYPYVANTSDQLVINPRNFQPLTSSLYSSFNFNVGKVTQDNLQTTQPLNDSDRNSFIESASVSLYPQDQQFYWFLGENRLVIETQGNHMNLGYQGSVSQQTSRQTVEVSTTFRGTQMAVALPVDFQQLVGKETLDDVSFTVGAARITLPPGANLADNAQFNLNITQPDGTVNQSIYFMDDAGKATTYDTLGGGSFFENLDARNAPEFFQGFPTVNLKPLLNNGVTLEVGSVVPRENLIALGLTPGDILTRQGFSFQPQVSSVPGVKPLRLNQTENNDLVAVLSNPFLTKEQKDLHYLNSFMWNNLGYKTPKITSTTNLNNDDGQEYWSRYTFSLSRNRSLIYYDPEEIKITYSNVFSNPGISLTTAEWNQTDVNQSVNASVGLIVGGLFNLINPGDLNKTLNAAKEEYQQLRSFGSIKTKSSSGQRRQMNIRLNNTLGYADTNTNLSQVSGSYTFAANVTPNSSSLFQFRTGIYKRLVQFVGQEVQPWNPDQFFVIESVSFPNFNPIAYVGINLPTEVTSINNNNNNRTVDLSFIQAANSNGEVLFNQSFVVDSGKLFTAAPIPGGGKAFTSGSARIVMGTSQEREIKTFSYIGDIYLPAMEFLMSGTVNSFNYALSAGMWFNLFPDSAPMVNTNLSNSGGTKESSMGGTLKLSVKTDLTSVAYDDNKQWSQIISNSPFFSLAYNTNANALNLSTISFGNVFQLKKRDYSVVFYPVLSYAPAMLNPNVTSESVGELVSFLSLRFSHKSSFDVNASMSINNGDTTYRVDATYNIINNSRFGTVTIGASYFNSPNHQNINLSNYSDSGLAASDVNFQTRNSRLGWILGYRSPNSNWVINSRLEDGEGGWNGRISMQLKF